MSLAKPRDVVEVELGKDPHLDWEGEAGEQLANTLQLATLKRQLQG